MDLRVAFDLGGFPLRQRHLVTERFQTFDQVTSQSHRIQGVKVVASQFLIVQMFVVQQVVEYNQQGVGHGHNGSFLAAAACQAAVVCCEIRVL